MKIRALQNLSLAGFQAAGFHATDFPMAFLAAIFLVCMTGAAAADDIRIIDLSAQTDSQTSSQANPATDPTVLNGDSGESYFSFSGGVGSGPDLSGNGNMVQIVQPITQGGAAMAGNGQISYRYVPVPPTGGGH